MSRIFCPLYNERIKDRIVFDSYESAEEILGAGNFIEETEETGPLFIGGIWDGTTCVPPTVEEISSLETELNTAFIFEPDIPEALNS